MLGRSSGLLRPVLALVFCSGLCAVAYQIAWLRLLRLIFGASTAANATVLAIFMGGLGLGGLVLGKWVDRAPRPLDLYARLELGIGIGAGLTPLLILGVRALYLALGGTYSMGWFAGNGVRVVLSVVVLALPTFLMGGTLPAVARAVEHEGDRGRRSLGLLYGVNTLGAVSGAVLVTFVGIELLGTQRVIWIAALINLLVAISARSLARRSPELVPAPEGVMAEPSREHAVPRSRLAVVLFGATTVGFVFFVMELVWYRMLAPLLGGSSYSFGLILAVALLGIGLGGLVYGLETERRRPTLSLFAFTCALEALLVVLPLALGDRLAFLALILRGLGDAGFAGIVLGWTAVTMLVVLPPAIVAGYQFPVLVGVLGEGRARVGWQVGLTYAFNTAGAIAGAVLGGFVLIPSLGAPGSWRLSTVLLAGLALLVAWAAGPREGRVVAVAAGALALLLLFAPGPSAVWRHGGIGAGRMQARFDGPNAMREVFENSRGRLLWEVDGRESTVALVGGNDYAFLVNGKSDGSARGDAPTQVLSGLVGAVLHPDPRTAVVIGLGTGSSAGWLAAVPSIERVDVAELEPAILRVAEACEPVNQGVLANPKVEIHLGDGRELLLTSNRTYDIILSEPSNPYRAGVSSLFTHEFYRAAARRLNEGGLFLQWLQGYETDASVVATAYATLVSVFPVVESWQVHSGDLLLVAGAKPIAHDLERIARRVEAEPIRSALSDVWGVEGVAGFYAGFLATPDLAVELAREVSKRELNTDDRPVIEFGFVRNLGRGGLFDIAGLHRLAASNDWDRPRFEGGELDWGAVLEARMARAAIMGAGIVPVIEDGTDAVRQASRRAFRAGAWEEAARQWSSQDQPAEHHADRLAVAAGLSRGGSEDAGAAIARLAEVQPSEALALQGLWSAQRREWASAASSLEQAYRAFRSDPWPHPAVTELALRASIDVAKGDAELGRKLFEAMREPFAAGNGDALREGLRVNLAYLADFDGLCREAFAALEPHPPWNLPFLSSRAECYRLHNDPRFASAERDIADFLAAAPPRLPVSEASESVGPPLPKTTPDESAGRAPAAVRDQSDESASQGPGPSAGKRTDSSSDELER